MNAKKVLSLIIGLAIACMSFTSCIEQEEVDLNNNDYELFFYGYAPKVSNADALTADQESIFNLFAEIYQQRLQKTPGYYSSQTEGCFKILNQTLFTAMETVSKELNSIPADIAEWSDKMGADITSKIDFPFVMQVCYKASDTTIGYIYSKMYGDEYYVAQ